MTVASMILLSVALLRPHEHSFQGLDASAYRLMAKSFSEGRRIREPDQALRSLPENLRPSVMLIPPAIDTGARMTRDRSFQVEDLSSCSTKPFFYPLLPLCMWAFGGLFLGHFQEYVVPLVCLCFALYLLLLGSRIGGCVGVGLVLAMFFASPLPVWIFRGCFVEAISTALICSSVIWWLSAKKETWWSACVAFLGLGLSVSFHPVMIVLVFPLAAIMFFQMAHRLRIITGLAVSFVLGLLPVIYMTLFVASPYGDLSFQNFSHALKTSASIRPAIYAVAFMTGLLSIALALRRRAMDAVEKSITCRRVATGLVSVVSILPTLLALRYWEGEQGRIVMRGLKEFADGVQGPFIYLLVAGCLGVVFLEKGWRAKMVLMVAFATLPYFLYLKGAEGMGLWSQRRLVLHLMLIICSCIPYCAGLLNKIVSGRLWAGALVAIGLISVGCCNAYRWPAPYVISYEKGSDQWVDDIQLRIIKDKLTVFDYHPFSVPFAVNNRSRVIGLSEFAMDEWPTMIEWLRSAAASGSVQVATAYANPGLELGVDLREVSVEEGHFKRVHAKGALPAVEKQRDMRLTFADVVPVTRASGLVLDKVFDGGVIALRGPWGRTRTMRLDNEEFSAQWTRDGSGIVGPIAAEGGKVRMILTGAFVGSQRKSQKMLIVAPWSQERHELLFSDAWQTLSIDLNVDAAVEGATGVYHLYASQPYDPDSENVRGYDPDLGIMLRRIQIECFSDDVK